MTALSVVTLESCDLCIFNSCCPIRWSSKLKAIIESLFGLTNMYIIPFKNNAFSKKNNECKELKSVLDLQLNLLISSPTQSGKTALFIHTPFLPSSRLNEYHLHSTDSTKFSIFNKKKSLKNL